jgi:hypothetical protein
VLKAKLDATRVMKDYGAALRRLSSLTGMDQRAVLLSEAGIILKTCAGRTKVATDKRADQRTWAHILGKRGLDVTGNGGTKPGSITVNAGMRGPFGRVWVKTKNGKFKLAGQITPGGQGFRPMNYHWANATWTDIQETTEDIAIQSRRKMLRGRRAAGLARQSWLQVADGLGIDLASVKGGGSLSPAGIAKARAALATTGRANRNGTGTITGDQVKTTVTLINRLPYGIPIGLDRLLLGVMAGRAKFFHQSYAKGAFDTMSRTARAYPWIRVRPPVAA